MKHLLFAVLFVSITSTAYAGSCDSISCTGKVVSLYVNNDKSGYVWIDGASSSNLSCSLVSGLYMTLTGSEPAYNIWYATLLAAQTTGTPVTVRIIERSTGCAISYITKVVSP